MLQKTSASDQASMAAGRIVALDRARTFTTLLVVIHHSVVNYTHFGNGDRIRWLGFDLVVLFNDSFFMAFMFLISGLFVHDSLTRRGAAGYLRRRFFRLGVPLLVSIFVLIPIAYYASFLRYHFPGTTDFNFFHFWWHTMAIGPWPSGQSWFLWVLLVFDLIAVAIWSMAPRVFTSFGRLLSALRERPFLTGEYTLADAHVNSFVDWLRHMKIEMNGLERLGAWSKRCSERPAYARAMERENS